MAAGSEGFVRRASRAIGTSIAKLNFASDTDRESRARDAWHNWRSSSNSRMRDDTTSEELDEMLNDELASGAGECVVPCGCFFLTAQTRRRRAAVLQATNQLRLVTTELAILKGENNLNVMTLASLSSKRRSTGAVEPVVESVLVNKRSVGFPMSTLPQACEPGTGMLGKALSKNKCTHWELAKKIGARIRDPEYHLKAFYDDCVVRQPARPILPCHAAALLWALSH